MEKKEYLRLIKLLKQREEMSGLGADEADELLLLLKKASVDIESWINDYPSCDKEEEDEQLIKDYSDTIQLVERGESNSFEVENVEDVFSLIDKEEE